MGKRISWQPKYIENVRNENFTHVDFDFLIQELAELVYDEMLVTRINPNITDSKNTFDESKIE